MDLKKIFNLNNYTWWRNHRKLVTYSGLLIIFSAFVYPVVQEAKDKNKCISIAQKRFLEESAEKNQLAKDSAFVLAYQVCNHRSQ
tara:strand:+ start:215 stop:469 length:255 start_codon:yes stop_codon:yes gene_type:complete